jgi:hypothetical protein
MRTTLRSMLIASLALGLIAGSAFATENNGDGNHDHHPEPHPHLLLLHVEIDVDAGPGGTIVDWDRCVDLAGNQALRNFVHHENVHFGQAGQALENAGHRVVPAEPFWDDDFDRWSNCAELEEFGEVPLPPPGN